MKIVLNATDENNNKIAQITTEDIEAWPTILMLFSEAIGCPIASITFRERTGVLRNYENSK